MTSGRWTPSAAPFATRSSGGRVSTPPVRSDDVRGKQFSTHRPGYDKKQVDAFLEAAGLRLAAMESTDRPAGPLVSGAILAAWAEWADSTTFSKPSWRRGYDADRGGRLPGGDSRHVPRGNKIPGESRRRPRQAVLLDRRRPPAMTRSRLTRSSMPPASGWPRWSRRTGQTGPLVSGAILAGWAEWADSTTIFNHRRLREGYDTAEVDAFREELRDTFLGVRRPPLTWPASPASSSRLPGPGYDVEQVDAFLDKAEPRLAAINLVHPVHGRLGMASNQELRHACRIDQWL